MIGVDAAYLAVGGGLLWWGAETLVSGASGVARSFRVGPLAIGLTVVAYGTSAPEAVVSSAAALDGRGLLALGNVVGSNVANLALILGATALIRPQPVDGALARGELPAMAIATLLLPLLLLDGRLDRTEGTVLLAASLAFTVWTLRRARSGVRRVSDGAPRAERAAVADGGAPAGAVDGGEIGPEAGARHLARSAAGALLGLALLVAGGKIFLHGATSLAYALGISERVVGLTIVAIGTSLPELATSLVAAFRGKSGIVLGNVVGSNLFNIAFILGLASILAPIDGSLSEMRVEIWGMLVVTAVGVFLLRRARLLTRAEGALLVAIYVLFLTALTADL